MQRMGYLARTSVSQPDAVRQIAYAALAAVAASDKLIETVKDDIRGERRFMSEPGRYKGK